jgi:hypothetical protein
MGDSRKERQLLWLEGEGDTPGKFRPPHHLKVHREQQQGREGKQNGSAQCQAVLDRCIAGSQPKTASALRVPIPDQTPDRECPRRASGFVCAVGEEMKRLLAEEQREKADLGSQWRGDPARVVGD